MSAICTYCGDPIGPTEKTGRGPAGKVHSRCAKRTPVPTEFVDCPSCTAKTYSLLLDCCMKCHAVGRNTTTTQEAA